MGGILLARLRAPSQMGRRLAPYKRFGPGAQNLGALRPQARFGAQPPLAAALGAEMAEFTSAEHVKFPGGPEGRPRACPRVRKKYGLKAARRAWPALRHTHLRGSADPASGAAALKWPRFFRRRRRFGHFPSSASADLSAGVIKMPPIWAAFCLRSFRAPSQMGRRFAPYKGFGPGAQNLSAGGIHFRRACKVSRDPKDRLSKKRLYRFFEKDHMAEGVRFLAKKSPLPP